MESDVASWLDETVAALAGATRLAPSIGVVLGSGLAGFADRIKNAQRIPFARLPHLAVPRTQGNPGNVCLGVVDDAAVMCLEGRSHLYEGYPSWQVVHGVRLMARLGVRAVLLTDAVTALDPTWTGGTMMVVKDHLDLLGGEPLASPGVDGTFAPAAGLVVPYDADLGEALHDAARSESLLSSRIGKPEIVLRDGVYAAVRDPSCLTAAQGGMLRALGASVVGTTIVPEVAALRPLGVRLAGLAYVVAPEPPPGRGPERPEQELERRSAQARFDRVVRGWILRAHRS